MSDKEISLIDELNELPRILKPFGDKEEEPRELIDPMARPLWEIDADFINPFEELPPIQTWAVMGDRPAIPKQGIITFSAKQKKGKSLSVYAFSLALLSGEQFDNLKAREEPRLIMIFDFEMSKTTLVNRVRSIATSLGAKANRFVVCSLKATKGIAEQRATIEKKIAMYQPDIVVIDQVAKLLLDINSTTESESVSRWVDNLSLNRSVWVVIHENKAADDGNMRGHIGTSLAFANVEAYTVSKDKGVFTIAYKEGRDSESEGAAPVRFALSRDGMIITASDILASNEDEERQRLLAEFADIFGNDDTLPRSEIESRVKAKFNCVASTASQKVTEAIGLRVLEKIGNRHRDPYRMAKPALDFEGIESPSDDDEL